jgi:site-specific recombinase XerD
VTETQRSFASYNRRLTEQYDKWMIAMHYARTTRATYLKVLQLYNSFLESRSVATASHGDIRLFIAHASENGATLGTVYRYLGILRQFYDFLNLGGVVSYVAPRFVRLRAPWHGRPGSLSEAQVRRLISATQTARERALVEFFYSTGCRLSETLHLRIEEMDLTARSARVRGKLGKTRLVLLTESAANAVRNYIGDRQSGFVFEDDLPLPKGHLELHDGRWKSRWRSIGRSGQKAVQRCKCLGNMTRVTYEEAKTKHEKLMAGRNLARPKRKCPLSKMAVQCLVRKLALRAGVKNVSPHTFRRTFATHLHEHGASLEVIRALLGHVWVQTTMRYARIGPDGLSKTFEKCHPFGNQHGNTST